MKFLGVELQSTFVYNQQGPRRKSTKPIPKILHLPILTPKDKYNIYSSINSYFPSGNQRSSTLSTSDSISGVT